MSVKSGTEFKKHLVLTSPPEKSNRVADAQYLLRGHNKFKQNFHPGPVDKTMGEQTAGAIRRAKWFLGYPKHLVNNSMGQNLYDYLVGRKNLPVWYRVLKRKRLKAAREISTGKIKAVNLALSDARAGIHEYPAGSNRQKYGEWYGFNGVFWCCIAITYWLVHSGNKNWKAGSFASYVGAVVDAARYGSHHLALTTNPEKGDLACYNNNEHIEFFVEWISKGSSFRAVGGNTSSHDGSYSNGGEVAENIRYVNGTFPVTHFVKVGL